MAELLLVFMPGLLLFCKDMQENMLLLIRRLILIKILKCNNARYQVFFLRKQQVRMGCFLIARSVFKLFFDILFAQVNRYKYQKANSSSTKK